MKLPLPLLFITLILLALFSFKTNWFDTDTLKTNFALDLKRELENLDVQANAFRENKISLDSLQIVFLNSRKAYKKAEFQLTFQFPEFITSKINGAPLLHIEKENSRPILTNPEGFQVLDELLFSDETDDTKNEISNIARRLKNNYNVLYEKIQKSPWQSKEAIMAIRLQLVRIFTLGVTGFDTPGSANALPDAVHSLEGIKTYVSEQNDLMPEKNKLQFLQKIEATISFLQQANFENLDRLALVKNYLDPMYADLLPFQNSSPVRFTTSWNPNSTSLFDKEFLNPYQFTNLKKETDSEELTNLGKQLFYDAILSQNQQMSCATCHQPNKSFADGIPKSISNKMGIPVLRNAPTLLNSVFADRYFYDLRAYTLEQQVEHVIFNTSEFNTSYTEILEKLDKTKKYKNQFKKLFQTQKITREHFTKALASYVLSLQSNNSEFDKYIRGESNTLANEAINGFNLFTGKAACATCHFTPTFSGLVPPLYTENESEILGVLSSPKAKELDTDEGRFENGVLYEKSWIYEKSFKTVTVRNSNETAPYFHNGAYTTLEEVIDFYNEGGGEGVGIPTKNQTLSSEPLNLTDQEKKDLVTFLKTLSDNPYNK